ncbi:hypothetical protein P152DRAFT_475291 [Eremomyces bilateralis CBS 781.70]|uniref:Uncharacterized protein n=1 Tax=Eremomyces bilateralis CBS 781.70 TaxID=1392243 RepID=A0A6G1FY93_9PEZI|nr:uncharacterized protein P152DRAFT_475291 [Eremomyces bilateralis CBS 781.70]KAF1810835.1 hypothetical protein P152DRAFT_475291 [Eremomyces bilateralis CBS 781.70]
MVVKLRNRAELQPRRYFHNEEFATTGSGSGKKTMTKPLNKDAKKVIRMNVARVKKSKKVKKVKVTKKPKTSKTSTKPGNRSRHGGESNYAGARAVPISLGKYGSDSHPRWDTSRIVHVYTSDEEPASPALPKPGKPGTQLPAHPTKGMYYGIISGSLCESTKKPCENGRCWCGGGGVHWRDISQSFLQTNDYVVGKGHDSPGVVSFIW